MFYEFYTNTDGNITLVVDFLFHVIVQIFWASLPMYLPVIILLAANNCIIHDSYIDFDSNPLKEAADVEVAGHQEGGPAESSIGEHLGTAQLESAHEDNGANH